MRAPCFECNKILFLSEFHEIVYDKDGPHLLCSKECKDKWQAFGRRHIDHPQQESSSHGLQNDHPRLRSVQ